MVFPGIVLMLWQVLGSTNPEGKGEAFVYAQLTASIHLTTSQTCLHSFCYKTFSMNSYFSSLDFY